MGGVTPLWIMTGGGVVGLVLLWFQIVLAGRAADAERERDGG